MDHKQDNPILNSENPFDKTGIHPESYKLAEKLLKELKITTEELGNPVLKLKLEHLDKEALALKFDAGVNTIVYSGELPVAVKEPNDPAPEPALVYVKSAAVRPVGVSLTSILNVIDEAAVVDPEAPWLPVITTVGAVVSII